MFNRFKKSNRLFLGLSIFDWFIIACGVSVFAFICFFSISKSSIWFDEAFGAYLIRFDFIEIAKYTGADVHPPFYYWLLKLWSMAFGSGELALRSFSVVLGGMAVSASYILVNKLFGKKSARYSLALLILSPMIIRYAQEARMYMLVALISILATIMLIRATESGRRQDYIVYGILVGLGMLTHYFSAIVWIAHWLWRIDHLKSRASNKRFLKSFFTKDWVVAHIVAVGLFALWLPFFIKQLFIIQYNGFWIPSVSVNTLPNYLTNIFYYLDSSEATGWLAVIALASLGLIGYLAFSVYQKLNKQKKTYYKLICSIAFLPVLILIILSMPPLRPSFIDRYLIASIFGFIMFIGVTLSVCLDKKHIKISRLVGVLVIMMSFVGIANVYRLGNFNKTTGVSNNTREVLEKIFNDSSKGQPVIARSPWTFYEAVVYTNNDHKIYFLDNSTDYSYGSLEMLKPDSDFKIKEGPSLEDFKKRNPIVWYIGKPGDEEMKAPYSDWVAIKTITVDDSVTGKPAYKAIQYRIGNK